VEYLLVTLTHGFPQEPKPAFTAPPSAFPVENREAIGQSQEYKSVSQAIGLRPDGQLKRSDTGIEAVSDFHLLCFLRNMAILNKVRASDALDFLLRTLLTSFRTRKRCYAVLQPNTTLLMGISCLVRMDGLHCWLFFNLLVSVPKSVPRRLKTIARRG
jgi:hypothetical protein